MYRALMVGKFVKQDVREWYSSTTGPLLPTMTDSLFAPDQEVLYKRYHTGEPVEATDNFACLKYSRNGRDYGLLL